jgi:Fe-S cluster biosynthesis and repair protein YggX
LPSGLNIGGAILLGTTYDRGTPSQPPELVNGYRITDKVPKETWDDWLKVNRKSPVFVNGIVFADADRKKLVEKAKTMRRVKNGFEPMGGGQARTK